MIACGSILSGPEALGSDPEAFGPFTNSFITYRALIWEKMVAISQGLDAWTYLKPAKKHHNGIMGYKLIYNHYLGPSNIYRMAAGADKNIDQYTYTGKKRNWTLKKYSILNKEQHNTLNILKNCGYTGIYQQSKFRYLSEGINATGINSVKTRIVSDENLRQDFDGCVTLYKVFVKQSSRDDR